ncbi:hypothetical protein [Sutcliffiella horikoshii]|uniref:hypothetical protein n=1 Tax=Sutcliffiella horikoshii TaxID=79883 RepID=UPI0012FC2895|nr:hypothetical protein [Sutcliffiella horikoshii]
MFFQNKKTGAPKAPVSSGVSTPQHVYPFNEMMDGQTDSLVGTADTIQLLNFH